MNSLNNAELTPIPSRSASHKIDRITFHIIGWYVLAGIIVGTMSYLLVVSPFLRPYRTRMELPWDKFGTTVLLALCLFAPGAWLARRWSITNHPVRLFTVFYVLRLVLATLYPAFNQFDDEHAFHEAVFDYSYKKWSLSVGHELDVVSATLYSWFGANMFLPRVFNAFVGALSPFVLGLIARVIWPKDSIAIKKAIWIAALAPPFLVYSSVTLKECTTMFFLAVAIYGLVSATTKSWSWMSWTLTGFLGLLLFRGGGGVILPLAGLVPVVVRVLSTGPSITGRVRYPWIYRTVFVILVGVCLGAVINAYVMRSAAAELQSRWANSSALVKDFLVGQNVFDLKNSAFLFARGLVSPPPLEVFVRPDVSSLTEAFVMLTWYCLLPLAFVGVVYANWKTRNWDAMGVWLTVLVTVAVAALGVTLGGDLYRHRLGAFSLCVPLAAGVLRREVLQQHRSIIIAWWVILLGFCLLWMAGKGIV